jgi:type IV fimbrial biogenesis protein FimT
MQRERVRSGKRRREKLDKRGDTALSARLSQVGLTVVEVLIIFSVIAVILLLTAPQISALVQNRNVKNTASELYGSLILARGEAAKRHSTARICPSSDGRSCRNDGNWSRGWLVYSDGNANGEPEEMEIIQVFEPRGREVRVSASGAVVSDASFTIEGLLENQESGRGTFKICRSGSSSGSRKITVDQNGGVDMVKLNASCSTG